MQHRPGTKTVYRTRPPGSCPEIDGVVVSIREPESKQDAASCLQPECVDELLPHEAHRRRAEDDHALLVQPNDTLIRTEVEQFGEMESVVIRRIVV
jgi:hypothetical protein